MINVAKPILGKEEEKAVIEVLRSGSLAQGKKVEEFENGFAKYVGAKYGVAVTNGTAALHLVLLALGIKEGDEVITTPFSFIASANAILYTNAKPVFADIDSETLTIDPKEIEKKITKKTKAIIPVHLFGLPANMPEIRKIAKKYKLKIIEDACQSHGASIDNKKVGVLGDAACFSFYPTKNITSGEGGMITTDNTKTADTLRLLRSHGMRKRYHHEILGFNLRLTDISAAIGVVQLKKIEKFNKKRQKNAEFYFKELKDMKGLILPLIPKGYGHVFNQFTIRVTKDYPLGRDELRGKLESKGIASEIYYPIPIHKQELYKKMKYKSSFPNSENASKTVLSIPIHPDLTLNDLEMVVKALKSN